MTSLLDFSVNEIVSLRGDERIGSVKIASIQEYAFHLHDILARSIDLAWLISVPFGAWSDACKIKLIEYDPMILMHLYELDKQIVTQDMADYVFDQHGMIVIIPDALRTEEHWIKFLANGGHISSNSIASHLRSEAFWLKAIEAAPHFRHFNTAILPDDQTAAIIDKLVDMPKSLIFFRNIRPDLLTDSVVGKIMLRDENLQTMPETVLLRGMRWLLDNGRASLLDECNASGNDRGPGILIQLHRQLVGRGYTHRYYQVVEELRDYPPGVLAEHVTQDTDVELFRMLHGTEMAIRLLGDRCAKHKRSWIGQEFDL